MLTPAPRRSPLSSTALATALAAMVTFTGCGPVAIGAGLASTGGGSSERVSGPVISQSTSQLEIAQPVADKTLIAFRLAQAEARTVRLRLEFDAGSGRQTIPVGNLLRVADAVTLAPGAALATDANGNFLLPASGTGVDYLVLWDHRAQFGVVEPVGVQVWTVADLAPPEPLVADAANSTRVIARRTLGRQLSEIAEVEFARLDAQNSDSAFRLRAKLRDQGQDALITLFDVEYALTQAAPTATDWVALAPQVPQVTATRPLGDGRTEYDVELVLDPFALGWTLGEYQQVSTRLRHREDYPPVRRGLTPEASSLPQTLAISQTTDIGFKPQVVVGEVVDPGNANSEEFRRVLPRLAIPFQVRNPSAIRPMRVRVSGDYYLADFAAEQPPVPSRPMTLFVSGAADAALEFDLAPGVTAKRFVVWNVIADEGLGCAVPASGSLGINNPLKVADVFVIAEALAPTTSATGRPLRTRQLAPNTTTLCTLPFVEFRTNLVTSAERVYSAGIESTAATRDLFYTVVPATLSPLPPLGSGAQDYLLGLNQQFEPIQITPEPQLFDVRPSSGSPGSGVFELVPTDFQAGSGGLSQPDCIFWRDTSYFTAVWPTNGQPPTIEPIASVSANLPVRSSVGQSFVLNDANGSVFVAVFYTHTQPTVVPQDLQLQLNVLSRRRNLAGSWVGDWAVTQGPGVVTFQLPATPSGAAVPVNLDAEFGEFDGNPATKEIVFACVGSEFATGLRRGLMDMFVFGLDGAGAIVVSNPIALPSVTIANTASTVEEFRLVPWRTAAGGVDGIAYLRQLNNTTPPQTRLYDVHVLRGSGSGSLASGAWTFETRIDSANGYEINNSTQQILDVYSTDLDSAAGGIGGSDLLLAVNYNRGAVGIDSSKRMDVWHYANRSDGRREWRRVLGDVRAQLPSGTTLSAGNGRIEASGLVDVNGDRFPDFLSGEEDNTLLGNVPERARFWNYFSSSLAGVAGGLKSLPLSGQPGQVSASRLPGTLDANFDGQLDLVAGDRLYLGSAIGRYTTTSATGFLSGITSYHRVEKIYGATGADAVDVLVYDGATSNSRIVRVTGFASVAQPQLGVIPLATNLGFASPLLSAVALAAPDSGARDAKDVLGLTAGGAVLRRRLDGGNWTAFPVAGGFSALASAGLAVIRRGGLTATNLRLERNDLVQDFAVVRGDDANKVLVWESHNGYQPRSIALPAGESAVRIAAASATADTYEDLLVLTVLGSGSSAVWRVRTIAQNPDPLVGLGGGAPTLEFLRFGQPYAQAALRSFAYDQATASLAEGFLLFDDEGSVPGTSRSEARFVRASVDPGNVLGIKLTRSPIGDAVDNTLDAVIADTDADGFSEVVGGQWTVGVRRVARNQN
jgi:hypothetical protein